MKAIHPFAKRLIVAAALAASVSCFAADPAADAALAAIRDLGTVNGKALACAEMDVAGRAKKLMLAHAPKTQTYGDAFQDATNDAFLAQANDRSACNNAAALSAALDELAQRLNSALPVAR